MLIQPVLRPVLQPVLRSALDPGIGGGGSPSLTAQVQALFAKYSAKGGMWDLVNTATLFQDSAGTTPVTGVSQPVGLALDVQQAGFITVDDAVWTKTGGDGVVSVTGNTITVTGATTPTRVTRTGGSIPAVTGLARMRVTATYSGATGVEAWLRGSPQTLASGVGEELGVGLSNSDLERLDVGAGSATFVVENLRYWVGNHLNQPTSGKRPLFNGNGITLDGVDDFLATAANIDLASSSALVCVGLTSNSDGYQKILELGPDTATSNGLALVRGFAAAGDYAAYLYGTSLGYRVSQNFVAPDAAVVSTQYNIAEAGIAAQVKGSRNGTEWTYSNSSGGAGTGTLVSNLLSVGQASGGAAYFNGSLRRAIIIGAVLTADDRTLIEAWAAEGA